MRTFSLPLIFLASVFTLAAQETPVQVDTPALKILTVPVELSRGIKADKALPGDEVRMRMVEPILAGNGLVIPESARLYGRILAARPVQNGKPSRLSVLIERAEWKGHVLCLHAFIEGLGMRQTTKRAYGDCNVSGPQPPPVHSRGRGEAVWGGAPAPPPDACADETLRPDSGIRALASQIRIFTNPETGSTVLVSKKNIRLPTGILLVLRNISEDSEEIAERASVK